VNYDEYDAGPEAVAEPAAGTPALEATQIQPPEKPRGPHRAPAREPRESGAPRTNSGGGFGAGIFE
jgi:hypothetical protein